MPVAARRPDYACRLRRVLWLTRPAQVEHVLLLGGCVAGTRSEAAAGHAWLLQHGLPAAVRVELEQDSVDSLENLRLARLLLMSGAAAALPPVALLSSRYHLARCLLLTRALGLQARPVAAEAALPWQPRYLGRLLLESVCVMWLDLGLRWARLIGHWHLLARFR